MRKTLNINLGGIAFIIDENAYELLHNYLETLRRKFGNDAEREEIMADIESRIAEMLQQKLANRREVISIEEVQPVIDMMGRPEDIAGEEATTTEAAATTATTTTEKNERNNRKLYRDTDDVVVGGVISGLCHYFGINDPIWMRVAAAILIPSTGGSIIPLYLLMLILVPKAKTAAEKLQMKGEPINIGTIEKEVREAAVRTGDSINRIVKGENFFERVWEVTATILRLVGKMLAVLFIILGVLGLLSVGASFGGFYLLGTAPLASAARLLVDNPSTISMFSMGYVLFFAAPLIGLIYVALRALLGRRSQVRWLKWGLLGAWLLGAILLSISGVKTLTNFKAQVTKKEQQALIQPANGILYVQLADSMGRKINADEDEDTDWNVDMDGVFVNGVEISEMERIPVNEPYLELIPGDSFYVQQIITAHGRTKRDAEKNAASVIYPFAQIDTLLNLDPHLYIGKNGKWRAQDMKLRIAIPEGKKIRFADNIDIWHAIVKGDSRYDDTEFANTTWTVENGRVKCIEGENHFNDKDEDEGNSSHKMKVKVSPGEHHEEEDNSDKDF